MPPGSKRRWIWIVALLLVAGGGAYLLRQRLAGPRGPKFETTTVDRGSITAKVSATGTLSALVTVQVGTQVSGRVEKILVDFNSKVTKGQVIAKIDPLLFQAALEQARANYAAGEGNIMKLTARAEDARLQHERAQALFDRKAIAQQDLDTARANARAAEGDLAAARGQLQQAKASLHQAEVNLQYTTIVSPTTGVVISRNVDVGQTVAASLSAPTLFLIAEDLTKMQVDTSVSEADIGKLKPGMAATFTVDAYPTKTFRGEIRQLRNAPQTVQNVVTYDAVIDVSNPNLELRPGMTANVTFVYDQRDAALRVVNAALRFQPPPELVKGRAEGAAGERAGGNRPDGGARAGGGGAGRPRSGAAGADGGGTRPGGGRTRRQGGPGSDQRTLWTLRDGAIAPVAVRVGITDGIFTEIEGRELHEGDQIVTDVEGAGDDKKPPAGANQMRRMF
ncbi:MAG TPA: efflux RND transporter periplasmic adaptor subunit [Polyangia bacterium]|jgi:HlyD family secretion protein|nr:efflux RND transporter periplasmic adaptor subunit [Polyangia bacterium]